MQFYTKTQKWKQLKHQIQKAENKEETKKVKTGDDIFVVGYAFLLAVSLVVMIFLRRNKIED